MDMFNLSNWRLQWSNLTKSNWYIRVYSQIGLEMNTLWLRAYMFETTMNNE